MKTAIITLFIVILGSNYSFARALHVIYPDEEGRDKQHSYDYQLLKLALDNSGVEYTLSLSKLPMNEERARCMIASGSELVNVSKRPVITP